MPGLLWFAPETVKYKSGEGCLNTWLDIETRLL